MSKYSVSVINESNKNKLASISFIGQNLNITKKTMYLTAFDINCIVPVYIPRIVETFDSTAFVGGTNNVTDTTSAYFNKKWNTNLNICVSRNGSYSNQCVKFESVGYASKEPATAIGLTRTDVLFNQFFYHYTSLNLCRMIEAAINQALQDIGILTLCVVIKTDGKYMFLLPGSVDLSTVSLYFNYDLQHLFYLDTVNDTYANEFNKYGKLVYNSNSTYDYNDTSYYICSVLSLTTSIFPFTNLIFTSTTLHTEVVTTIIEGSVIPPTEKIIYSKPLTITDPDTIARDINFAASNLFNGNIIIEAVNKIDMLVSWATYDGITVPVNLDKYHYCKLSLLFI